MSKTLKDAYIDAVAKFIVLQKGCTGSQTRGPNFDCIELPHAASRILQNKEAWEKSVDAQTAVECNHLSYSTIIRHAANMN